MTRLAAIVLLLVPFIPGVRDIPHSCPPHHLAEPGSMAQATLPRMSTGDNSPGR
jgi:hypothetical protein